MPIPESDSWRRARARCLRAFRSFQGAHGRAPSVSELSQELGLSSPFGVQHLLSHLIDEGLVLAKVTTQRKAKRLSAAGERWLEEFDAIEKAEKKGKKR